MSAFNRLFLNIDQDRIDETRDFENFEDGDFPALKPNYYRSVQAHNNRACRFHIKGYSCDNRQGAIVNLAL